MINAILASAAMLAGAAYAGNAVVVNSCSYPVYLANTPAADGGYSEIDQTLQSGGSYSQQYTELTNKMGWSLKLAKDQGSANIMQYEYTYLNDGTIWFDLSDVNGNPWDGNWEITATGDCTPKQSAYRYSTDDAYGMQSCPDSSSVTVTLCSGDSDSGSTGGSGSSVSSSETYAATSATTAAPVSSATTTYGGYTYAHEAPSYVSEGDVKAAPTQSLTTFATKVTKDHGAYTVTNIKTEVVTAYVTATAPPQKRHQHHARHAHHA